MPEASHIPSLQDRMNQLIKMAEKLAVDSSISACCGEHAGAAMLAVAYLHACRQSGDTPAQAMQALPIFARHLSGAPEGVTIH